MGDAFNGFLFVVVLLVLVIVLILWKNAETNQKVSRLAPVVSTTAEKEINQTQYQNNAGQYVSVVMYEDFTGWLGINKDTKIVSIATVDKSGYGSTTAFVVVYEKIKKEN